MKKILSLIFLVVFVTSYGYSQSAAIKKIATKFSSKTIKKEAFHSAAKRSEKELLKEGIERTGKKYTGQALGEQIVKKSIRNSILEKMEKEGIESFFGYSTHVSDNIIKRIGKSRLNLDDAKSSKLANYANAVRNNASKSAAEKVVKREAVHLVATYCKKGGFEKFMKLSMKERMVAIQKMTKHIYSLPEAERKVMLESVSEPMRSKIIEMRRLMTTFLPSTTKGRWVGERGNSDFIINDDCVYGNSTVKELKKKYHIKGELRVKYVDGEPIFDKTNSLGTTKFDYKQEYDYKKIKLHDKVTENLEKEPWLQGKLNEKAINPVREYVENTAVDGTRVSGARNTYHEARDGETIYIVPDFIHKICNHNGGRAVARLVQK